MSITLTLVAQDAGHMLSELKRVSAVFGAATPATAQAPSAAQYAVISEASDQWLLEELQRRFLTRGFKIEVTELRAFAQADGTVPDPRQDTLDMSGDAEGSPVAPQEDPSESTPPPAEDDAPAAEQQARKRGRPPGSKNKAKDEAPAEDTAPAAPADADLPMDEAHKTALALLAQVFARGDAGQAAVRKVRDALGVKKFGDVPLAQAHDMLRMARDADAEAPAVKDAA